MILLALFTSCGPRVDAYWGRNRDLVESTLGLRSSRSGSHASLDAAPSTYVSRRFPLECHASTYLATCGKVISILVPTQRPPQKKTHTHTHTHRQVGWKTEGEDNKHVGIMLSIRIEIRAGPGHTRA